MSRSRLSALKGVDGKVRESLGVQPGKDRSFAEYHAGLLDELGKEDIEVYGLLEKEYRRVGKTLQLVAAENQCSRAVLAALGSIVQNKTTEGFAGKRFHGGCEVVDAIERLAITRAKAAFGARYANVQAHSGTQANQIVLTAVLERGDKILSLGMDQGGHVSHGEQVSFTGKFFDVEHYGVDKNTFLLDYEAIRRQALKIRPKLIICGATAYSRTIDFAEFRRIADEVGAFLMADVSHIAGLIIAGAHCSPIDHAHFTTTSTYKPGGPRGGLVLMGKDADVEVTLWGKKRKLCQHIEKATFPGVQGTPYLNHIAAKAVFFKETGSEEYRARQFAIIDNAKKLAGSMMDLGYEVISGGTDNHMVLVNVGKFRQQLTGYVAQKCLEDCGIIVNMNKLPYDSRPANVTSGMRLGALIVTKNGMGPAEMEMIAALIDNVLRKVEIISATEYRVDEEFKKQMCGRVENLCSGFQIR